MSPRALPPVLMYHHVYDGDVGKPRHPDSYIRRHELRRHLALYRRWGRTLLTLEEAATAPRRPRRALVLTFDDGCSCFAEHVMPLLEEYRGRATLFAVAGELGGTNRWDTAAGEREERLLDAPGLRRLGAGGIEIGCHSTTHPDLTRCEALEVEISAARAALAEAVGRAVTTFCYPYGAVNPRVCSAVEEAGYVAAAAIYGKPGAAIDDRFAIARMIVRPGESNFELRLKALGLYPLWGRLPRLGLLRALRRRSRR